MVILPTSVGGFEIDSELHTEDDFCDARRTGLLTMKRYNLTRRGSVIFMFFFPRYQREAAPALIRGFMHENTGYVISQSYKIHTHADGIPSDLQNDLLQLAVKRPVQQQYEVQLEHERLKYLEIANNYKLELERGKSAGEDQKKREEEYISSQEKARARRVESQLKGLGVSGTARDTALLKMEERDQSKKRQSISKSKDTVDTNHLHKL